MPSYRVKSKGFYDGLMYDPEGKRGVLHTEEPFPMKDKKEQVPSWLEPMKSEAPVARSATQVVGPTVKELKEKLTELGVEFKGNSSKLVLTEMLAAAENAAEVAQGNKDIADASFMGDGESTTTPSSAVETL